MKIILTESQFRILQEAVGVPEGILQAGEELYNLVSDELKTIDTTEESYSFKIYSDLVISDVTFTKIDVEVSVEEVEEFPYEYPVIASMGVGNEFNFDEGVILQVNAKSSEINLEVNFIAPEGWEPEELYNEFTKDKKQTVSVMSHEIMHRFHRQKQEHELMGGTADYNVYSSGNLRFGIPVINDFMRYSYFIQKSENIVRPTEIASRMIQKGVKKQDFYDFMVNDEVFTELKRIREFSYDYLMERLYEEMDSINELISHAGGDPDSMNDEEKVKSILELVYVNLVNAKVDTFDNFFYTQSEKMEQMFSGFMGQVFGKTQEPSEEKEKVRRKFINHVSKYKDREMDFFVDECERFNYVATNLMKKISKIYSLLPDEKEQTNESILDWELHQKLMEKRYGKRPIQTSYNFKK